MKPFLLYAAIFIYLGCIFVLIGFVLARMGVKQLDNYLQTPAKVVSAHIITQSRHPDNRRDGPSVAEPYWVLNIEYEYSIDSQQYTASDISNSIDKYERVLGSTQPPKYMTDLVDQYPVNAQIEVFVNPKRHSNAYIILDKNVPSGLAMVSFALFFVASLMLVIRQMVF